MRSNNKILEKTFISQNAIINNNVIIEDDVIIMIFVLWIKNKIDNENKTIIKKVHY